MKTRMPTCQLRFERNSILWHCSYRENNKVFGILLYLRGATVQLAEPRSCFVHRLLDVAPVIRVFAALSGEYRLAATLDYVEKAQKKALGLCLRCSGPHRSTLGLHGAYARHRGKYLSFGIGERYQGSRQR